MFNTDSLPRDLEAERAALGAMILDPAALKEVRETCKPEDFYEPRNEEIARELGNLADEGKPTDLVAIKDRLLSIGRLDKVGGLGYLLDLPLAVPSPAMGGYYAEIVLKRAQQRHLAELAMWMWQAATNPDTDLDDVPELLVTASNRINAELARVPGLGIPAAGELVDEVLEVAENPDRTPAIRTSWPDFNHIYRGHRPGQLIVLGARPAMGKTLIALAMGRHAAVERGVPTLYITLEIAALETMQRLFAAEAGIELEHLTESCCTDQDWDKLAKASQVLGAAPLYIHDVPSITVAGVHQAVDLANRSAIARHGAPIGLVIIDYLQIMSPGRAENRQLEVSGISRGLKQYAKEARISIIACAQINRGPEQRADKRPQMSDLRESGSLEADADNVILLHREDAYVQESPRAGEIDLIVTKQRNGPGMRTATLLFQGHKSRAVNYRRED